MRSVGEEEVAMECFRSLLDLRCIAALRSHEKDQRQHEYQSADTWIVVSFAFEAARAVRHVEIEKVTQRPADVRVGMGAGSCQEGQEALTEIGVSVR